ncbi:Probable prolyl 4-hydroxylase [Seminavis robusta]|uniref:Probable prolyl 4-hydroxylase n=1 Tax=Seminavis robusta TaxID=568900 RepID=A0A9N8H269_9STRA|nr:Probable prolyl 4-hydroxylase [Seminavis robusta]|eukprot:Sro13_g010220.1 Probable prolyl 4-hydroxylase (557) ;mRNA; r:154954-156901
MKSAFYLALPLAATVLNLLFASFLVVVFQPRKANAQVNIENLRLGFRPTEPEPYLTLQEETRKLSTEEQSCVEPQNEDDEVDPMLKPMPIDQPPFYKNVYTRADISSFYGEEPGSRVEKTPSFQGQAGKFINVSPHRMELYWENDNGGQYFIGNVGPWENGGTATHPNHKFLFKRRDTKEIVCRFTMKKGVSLYYYDPFVAQGDDRQFVANQGVFTDEDHIPRSLKYLGPRDRENYDEHRFNLKFATQYRNFTGGSEWLAHYPKSPPLHKIWRADYYGQEHVVSTWESHFESIPPAAQGLRGEKYAVKRNNSADIAFPEYRKPGQMNITIKAVSASPRAFQLDHFLSDVEVDHVLDVVKGRYSLRRSTTGNIAGKEESDVSETRTSKNTWVPRTASPILDAIYRRAADALRIDEALLRKRSPAEPQPRDISDFGADRDEWRALEPINEQMQIVHYDRTEEYTAHHDFGYSERASRSINLCIYLNEGMVGGETAFPRWRNAETSDSMKMVPEKGKAMIFYMVNPDGNLDDLTQHAAMPVIEGEKWFANLWIWDPFRT